MSDTASDIYTMIFEKACQVKDLHQAVCAIRKQDCILKSPEDVLTAIPSHKNYKELFANDLGRFMVNVSNDTRVSVRLLCNEHTKLLYELGVLLKTKYTTRIDT